MSPSPQIYRPAVIQVFCARTWGWRGRFAVHCWIAAKEKDADSYTRYEVMGWRARHGGTALVESPGQPDNYWFGSAPTLYAELMGEAAEQVLPRLISTIDAYPHKDEYGLWPGPNSNSFVAYVSRRIPELGLDLPPTAIGKDYLAGRDIFGTPVSGRGLQVSLGGLAGFAIGPVEGVEFHMLGLTSGFDFDDLTLKIPGFGRIPLG
jgi:hypothetical protein